MLLEGGGRGAPYFFLNSSMLPAFHRPDVTQGHANVTFSVQSGKKAYLLSVA